MIWLDILIALVVLAWVITRFTGFKLPVDLRDKTVRDAEFKKLFGRSVLGATRDPAREDQRAALVEDLIGAEDDENITPEPAAPSKAKRGRGVGVAENGLDEIRQRDRSFDEVKFLTGVERAVEYFYESWNARDAEALDQLCGPQLLANLVGTWEENNTWESVVLDGVEDLKVVRGRVHGRSAVIEVALKLRVREGKRTMVRVVDKVWILARALNGSDPNWELQEIRTVADA